MVMVVRLRVIESSDYRTFGLRLSNWNQIDSYTTTTPNAKCVHGRVGADSEFSTNIARLKHARLYENVNFTYNKST